MTVVTLFQTKCSFLHKKYQVLPIGVDSKWNYFTKFDYTEILS